MIGAYFQQPHIRWMALAAGLLLAAWAWQWAWRGPVSELMQKKEELAQLQAAVHAPVEPRPQLLAPEEMFVARGRREATMALQAQLIRHATMRGLLVEDARVHPAMVHAPTLHASISVSGPEDKLWLYIADIEAGQPVIRFSGWRLRSLAGGGVRLEAEAVAIWKPAS